MVAMASLGIHEKHCSQTAVVSRVLPKTSRFWIAAWAEPACSGEKVCPMLFERRNSDRSCRENRLEGEGDG
ncbi:hypothetical protein DFQ14_11530 [Halopolyspora algeriensis]|uniref:Uncharacterized protein n=1 Tax=Halopolyspora algeriensis TaxID=1500506 RepID=A0A368VJ15_9ACTN|nr:hypothetical protein DFQ14_11530 [Halopolyspora algeriensis]TQM54053.1 hypothetical protein FHU43_2231 [Halopolyspora algeriensis]